MSKPLRSVIADIIRAHAGDPEIAGEKIVAALGHRLDTNPEQQLTQAIECGDMAEFDRLNGDGIIAADFYNVLVRVCDAEQIALARYLVRLEQDNNQTGLLVSSFERLFSTPSPGTITGSWRATRHLTLMAAAIAERAFTDENLLERCGDAKSVAFIVRHHQQPAEFLAKLAPQWRTVAMDAMIERPADVGA